MVTTRVLGQDETTTSETTFTSFIQYRDQSGDYYIDTHTAFPAASHCLARPLGPARQSRHVEK